MYSSQQFKIQQLRLDKMILGIETIAVFILAVMVTIFLPSILYTYAYADQQLTAEPPVMQYIPVASFGVAVLFFAYATLKSIGKMRQIAKLEREMEGSSLSSSSYDTSASRSTLMADASETTVARTTRRAPAKKVTRK